MTYEEIEDKAFLAADMGIIEYGDIDKYIRHLCETYGIKIAVLDNNYEKAYGKNIR